MNIKIANTFTVLVPWLWLDGLVDVGGGGFGVSILRPIPSTELVWMATPFASPHVSSEPLALRTNSGRDDRTKHDLILDSHCADIVPILLWEMADVAVTSAIYTSDQITRTKPTSIGLSTAT